jgi:hypothetical protein
MKAYGEVEISPVTLTLCTRETWIVWSSSVLVCFPSDRHSLGGCGLRSLAVRLERILSLPGIEPRFLDCSFRIRYCTIWAAPSQSTIAVAVVLRAVRLMILIVTYTKSTQFLFAIHVATMPSRPLSRWRGVCCSVSCGCGCRPNLVTCVNTSSTVLHQRNWGP